MREAPGTPANRTEAAGDFVRFRYLCISARKIIFGGTREIMRLSGFGNCLAIIFVHGPEFFFMTIRASPKSNAKILASPRIYGEKILSELLDPDRRQRLLSLGQATYQASDGGDTTASDHEDRDDL